MARYIDPMVDWSFKRLFGTEVNKDILIGFLNVMFPQYRIEDIHYIPSEQLGMMEDDRKAIFDVAELARMGDEERKTYNRDMTTARDTYNQIVYAKEQGLEEGLKEGERKGREEGERKKAANIARKMLMKGMDVDSIAELTELTPQEIAVLKEPKASE